MLQTAVSYGIINAIVPLIRSRLWRFTNLFTYLLKPLLFCSAIVTLKHGEEAETSVSELSGVPLLGADVQISLYRGGDNLLCVTALPPTLCTDDAAFRTFVETFGSVEKCLLMRYTDGL